MRSIIEAANTSSRCSRQQYATTDNAASITSVSKDSLLRSGWAIAVFSLAVLVAACGGGGASGDSSSTVSSNLNSAPGETALVHYLLASHENGLTASNGGNTYTLQLSNAPNDWVTRFNGAAPAYSRLYRVNLGRNGTLVANVIFTEYFLLNPYAPLGQVSSTGSPYGVVTSSSPVPAVLTVGNSGSYYALTFYHDATMSVIEANVSVTYSVKANDSTTLLLCLDSTVSDVTAQGTADGLTDSTESDCYTVDSAGDVSLASVTLTLNNMTLTFQ